VITAVSQECLLNAFADEDHTNFTSCEIFCSKTKQTTVLQHLQPDTSIIQ